MRAALHALTKGPHHKLGSLVENLADTDDDDADDEGDSPGEGESPKKKKEDPNSLKAQLKQLADVYGKLTESTSYGILMESGWRSRHEYDTSRAPSISRMVLLDGEPCPATWEKLVPHAQPSPFGDLQTATTRLDTNVRLASEVAAKHLQLTPAGEFVLKGVSQEVSKTLFNGRPIKCVINKLNMYGPGGFFSMHVDTPRPGTGAHWCLSLTLSRVAGMICTSFRDRWDSEARTECLLRPSHLCQESRSMAPSPTIFFFFVVFILASHQTPET